MSVLSRAVAYNNLSGAAVHIGLSQPQLSRIVNRLESEMRVVLLDREVRRKSSWTAVAHRLAETWTRSSRNLGAEIQRLVDATEVTTLRAGTLEGLSSIALTFARNAFAKSEVETLELGVYDLSQLEELFMRGDLDLIFTFREPGRKKFKHSKRLGYQTLEQVQIPAKGGVKPGARPVQVLSFFEHGARGTRKRPTPSKDGAGVERVLLSNSLAIRREWLDANGGLGIIPSAVRPSPTGAKGEETVSMIGGDQLNPKLWEKVSAFKV